MDRHCGHYWTGTTAIGGAVIAVIGTAIGTGTAVIGAVIASHCAGHWTGTARHRRVVDRHGPTIGATQLGQAQRSRCSRWTGTSPEVVGQTQLAVIGQAQLGWDHWCGYWTGIVRMRLLDRHSPNAVIWTGIVRAGHWRGGHWDRHSLTAHCSPTGFRVKHRVFVSHPSYTSNAMVTVSR